jgi:hypothetical protein
VPPHFVLPDSKVLAELVLLKEKDLLEREVSLLVPEPLLLG